jgi:hypothetical protein
MPIEEPEVHATEVTGQRSAQAHVSYLIGVSRDRLAPGRQILGAAIPVPPLAVLDDRARRAFEAAPRDRRWNVLVADR